MRFLTWNLNTFTKGRWLDKIRLLAEDGWDVAALQEVDRHTLEAIRDSGIADGVVGGLDLTTAPDMKYPHGAALLVRGASIADACLIGGLPRAERGISARVGIDGLVVTVVSWHAPNAAGNGREIKMLGYSAVADHLARCDGPVVAGMDTNHWGDPIDLGRPDPDPEWWDEDSFLAADPPHGLVDAFRVYLAAHPEERVRIAGLRPEGPLAVTYDRGRKSFPLPDRFDRVFVSPGIGVNAVEHRFGDGLAAGSDHAVVTVDLSL